MIPGVTIPNIRLSAEDSVQPVKPTPAITDILSEFKPGQRVVAEIQAQLPNGTYRALIAQRDVTLALPFAAKSGDALELEIVETQGRLAFALISSSADGAEKAAGESTRTHLSATAQLIGTLLPRPESGKPQTAPALLNAGAPIVPAPPRSPDAGAQLAPALRQAVTTSGLFYESHQAAWVAGKTTEAALFLEPQGRLAPTLLPVPVRTAGSHAPAPEATPATRATVPGAAPAGNAPAPVATTAPAVAPASVASAASPSASPLPAAGTSAPATASLPLQPALLPDAAPLVQQQLSALASQVYAWHGAAWPGQRIEWEIVDPEGGRRSADDPASEDRWQTQLRLTLPSLGALDARLVLRGQQVDIELVARSDAARATLAQGGPLLREHYQAAGLQLGALGVTTGDDSNEA